MALTKLEVNHIALHRSAEAHAVDLEVLAVALADAKNHVADETLRGAVHGAQLAVFTGATDQKLIALGGDLDAHRQGPVELALGALDDDAAIRIDLDRNLGGQGDGLFADS
jgi:hypothetical protein